MTKNVKLIAAAAIAIALIGCVSTIKSAEPQAEWLSNMHRLSAAHRQLVPLVTDPRIFANPSRREEISGSLREMTEAVAEIVNDTKAPNADPIIAFTAMKLAAESRHAYAAYQMNDLASARFAFNRTSGYCISCHTRADRGAKDFKIGWTADVSGLSPLQNVEYLLANRQYATALARTKEVAKNGEIARRDPRNWILTIQKTLAMVVRVNRNPKEAKALATAVHSNGEAPFYLRRDASSWLKDIGDWQSDLQLRRTPSLKSAIAIIDRAQAAGPRGSEMLVRHLRASGMLHELLEKPKSAQYGVALYHAGRVANSLRDLNTGFLDQHYYEKCIEETPHSELAELCYVALEASVRDSNPFIELEPATDQAVNIRLAQYRKLSQVTDLLSDPRWIHRRWSDEFEQN